MKRHRRGFPAAVITLAILLSVVAWRAPAWAADEGAKITGTVRYHVDPDRVWRYRRYYVADHKTGEIAEAVVALRGQSLRKGTYPAVEEVAVIDQRDHEFVPETSAIRAGQTVRFSNSDAANHNVYSRDPLHPFNITIPSGGELTESFPRGGGISRPVELGCVFHNNMRAWVFVFEHPFFHVTASDGRYNLTGVPPGEYRLEMAHPAGRLRWSKEITVHAGETVTVDIDVSPDDVQKD
ncbi:MAG: carboxypeptidase regulatory-like domain-containing protein [Pirellulales bacterium]